MATENKKMKDPAEAALTAVEQALNLDETFVIHTPPRPGEQPLGDDPKLPDIDDHDFTRGPFGLGSDSLSAHADDHDPRLDDRARSGFVAPDRNAVANDDRQNLGVMLQALQVRPSRRPYWMATVLSLLWLGGVGALVYSQGITTPEQLLTSFSTSQLALGAVGLVAPVFLFFIAAMLTVR